MLKFIRLLQQKIMTVNNNDNKETTSKLNSVQLPEPKKMCCVRVPKVIDQFLIKRCLKCCDCNGKLNSDLCKKIDGVTSKKDVLSIGKFKNFNVTVNSVTISDASYGENSSAYKKVLINFEINFSIDVTIKTADNKTKVETLDYSVNQSINIPRFRYYNPLSHFYISKFDASIGNKKGMEGKDDSIKVEVLADCLNNKLVTINCDECCSPNPDKPSCVYLCIALGLFIIVRSEVEVQMIVPSYGYCQKTQETCNDIKPCEQFDKTPFPDLNPPL